MEAPRNKSTADVSDHLEGQPIHRQTVAYEIHDAALRARTRPRHGARHGDPAARAHRWPGLSHVRRRVSSCGALGARRYARGVGVMTTAVVVGGGPNGLAAAALLARDGLDVTLLEAADEVGGGTRSHEAILPGLLHDHCSAIHPMAVTSPALRALGLERHGLRWRLPEIDCVHPLDDGTAGSCCAPSRRPPPGLARTAAATGPSWSPWCGAGTPSRTT